MLAVIYIATVIYAFLSGSSTISSKKSLETKKRKRFFWLWCFALMAFLSITSDTYADVEMYTTVYDAINIHGFKRGQLDDVSLIWYLLCQICGWAGLNYRGMIVVVLFISVLIVHLALRRIDASENAFWGLFLLFPGILHIVQIKFFLGSAIVFYSVTFLLNTEKKYIYYLSGIMLAYLTHSSTIVFLLLLLVPHINKSTVKKYIGYTVAILLALIVLMKYIPDIASHFISEARVQRYFYTTISTMTVIGAVKVGFIWLSIVGLVFLCIKWGGMMGSNETLLVRSLFKRHHAISVSITSFINLYFGSLCLLGTTLILMYYDANFFRLVELGYMLGFVVASRYISSNHKNRAIIIVLFIVILIFAVTVYAPVESVIKPLFTFDRFVSLKY